MVDPANLPQARHGHGDQDQLGFDQTAWPTSPQPAAGASNAGGGQRAPHPRYPSFAQGTPLNDRLRRIADVRDDGDDNETPDHEIPTVHQQRRASGSEPRRLGVDTAPYPAMPRPAQPLSSRPRQQDQAARRGSSAATPDMRGAASGNSRGTHDSDAAQQYDDFDASLDPPFYGNLGGLPPEQRQRTARGIRVRHFLGALMAGGAVGLAHGREAGRQAREDVWAHGHNDRLNADAQPGLRRRIAARMAGEYATVGERWRASQRAAELEHQAMIRRMAGDYTDRRLDARDQDDDQDPRIQLDQASGARQPVILRAVQPVRHADRESLRRGVADGSVIRQDRGDGTDGLYRLPHFGHPNGPRPEHYYREPDHGVRSDRVADADQTNRPGMPEAWRPAPWHVKAATARFDEVHPLGYRWTEEERAAWIERDARMRDHEAALRDHRDTLATARTADALINRHTTEHLRGVLAGTHALGELKVKPVAPEWLEREPSPAAIQLANQIGATVRALLEQGSVDFNGLQGNRVGNARRVARSALEQALRDRERLGLAAPAPFASSSSSRNQQNWHHAEDALTMALVQQNLATKAANRNADQVAINTEAVMRIVHQDIFGEPLDQHL